MVSNVVAVLDSPRIYWWISLRKDVAKNMEQKTSTADHMAIVFLVWGSSTKISPDILSYNQQMPTLRTKNSEWSK